MPIMDLRSNSVLPGLGRIAGACVLTFFLAVGLRAQEPVPTPTDTTPEVQEEQAPQDTVAAPQDETPTKQDAMADIQQAQAAAETPVAGPQAFKTNFGLTYLMPVGGDFVAPTFSSSPTEDGARLPSARLVLGTQTGQVFGIHMGGLRLSVNQGDILNPDLNGPTLAQYSMMAGFVGFRFNITHGRVRAAPFVDVGGGVGQTLVDAGGFVDVNNNYHPLWNRIDGAVAGGGGGLALDLILGPGFTFSFMGGYYHFKPMGEGENGLTADPISTPFMGAGLSLTFRNEKWYWRTSGQDREGPMIAVVNPAPDSGNRVMIGDSVGTLRFLTSDLSGVRALTVAGKSVGLAVTRNGLPDDVAVVGEPSTGTITLNLHPGPNTIAVSAVDGAGNTRSRAFEVHGIPLDKEAPLIAVLTPDEDASVTDPSVTIAGVIADQGDIPEISVNGMTPRIANATPEEREAAGVANAAFVAKRFEVTVPVQPGRNTLQITAQDTAAQQNSISFSFQGPAPVVAQAQEQAQPQAQPGGLQPEITVTRPTEWNTNNTRGLTVVPKPQVNRSLFVEGFVRYTNGIREVKIAGVRAALNPDQTGQMANFSGFVPVQPGVTQVTVEATGLDGVVAQSTFPLEPQQTTVAQAGGGETGPSFASFTGDRERQRWAVVIGISDYADEAIPDLGYADDDAMAMYDFLTSEEAGLGGVPEEHIKLLVNEQATARNIRSALLTFLRSSTDDDIILIYIAGHGMPDPQRLQDLYLLAYDTELNDLAATGVPMEMVNEAINKAYAYNKVLITDACHSAGVGAGGTRAVNVNQINAAFTDYINSSSGGFVAFTSSEGSQLSQEGEEYGGGHGVFTYYLLQGLQGDADEDGDHIVTLGEMMEYTRNRVRRETQNAQIPTISLTNFDRFWPMSIVTQEEEGGEGSAQPPESR